MYLLAINVSKKFVEKISIIAMCILVIVTVLIVIRKYIKEKKISYSPIIICIFLVGMLLRTMYISYTTIKLRQHDVYGDRGHLAYIEYIYANKSLPKTNEWQFYQQPLHHIISAIWLKINTACGINYAIAKEGLCVLPAIYSTIMMLSMYFILNKLKIKEKFIPVLMAIIASHPSFIILSSSINNDMLVTMFLILDVLFLIKWEEKPNIKNTIILAILTALTVLSKTSGGLIAIPIMYVFIKKFCKAIIQKHDIGKYILKFALFGIISLSLGLSYSVRNKILFNQKLTEIPYPGEEIFCGYDNIFERLNPFSNEWNRIYCNPFKDSNILVYLTKCSIFGEYSPDDMSNKLLPILLITINLILMTISFICFLIIINPMRKKEEPLKILIWFYLAEMIMYISSNISMPFGCTMDIRYILPTIFLGMVFIAKTFQDKKTASQVAIKILTYLFVILSIILEGTHLYKVY